jgi:hypothetical protein
MDGLLHLSRASEFASGFPPVTRPVLKRANAASRTFQSAPRSPDRGDLDTSGYVNLLEEFQSAPRSPDRSDSS